MDTASNFARLSMHSQSKLPGIVFLLAMLPLAGGCTATTRKQLATPAGPHREIRIESRPGPDGNENVRNVEQGSDLHASVEASQFRPSPLVKTVTHTTGDSRDPSHDNFATVPPVPDQVETDASGMSLEDFEQLALQNNPSIQQASAAASKAAGIQFQVGLKPNPNIGYFGEEIGNGDSAGLHGAFVSQAIVRGGKLDWNRTVIGHDVQAARWQVESQRYRVRTDIRLKFYEALGAQKRMELARQFREVAAQGVEISQELVRLNEGALPDVLQSEVQLGEVELAIQRAEYELAAAWNELVSVVGLPELAPTALDGELPGPADSRELETTHAQLVAESPLLAAACARVRRARANLQRQQVQAIPNLNAQLGAGYDDGTGDEFANIQISVPVPIHNSNQGNIRAARADYCAAVQNVKRLKLQLRRQLTQAIRRFQVAQATVQQYETSILPKVGKTLQLMRKAQEAGEYDFLRVLTARRAYFDANLKYVEALTELAQSNTVIDGLLLTGSLDPVSSYDGTDELRGAALSGQ